MFLAKTKFSRISSMDPTAAVGYGIFVLIIVLLFVGFLACDWWCNRAYREARALRDENLDRVIEWFLHQGSCCGSQDQGGAKTTCTRKSGDPCAGTSPR